jgi:hypothetical protein
MSRREQSPERQALGKRWSQWTEIVRLFARHRRARKHVDVRAYIELRRDLIERCQRLAVKANEVEAPFYRYLQDLARPWLDPGVLGRAEREILFDLLVRCQHVRDQLLGRSWIRSLPSWVTPAVAGVTFFAIMLLWMGKLPVFLSTILDYSRGYADDVYFYAIRSSDAERLLAVGLVLVIVSAIAVSRTARS